MTRALAALLAAVAVLTAGTALADRLHHDLVVRIMPAKGLIEVRARIALPSGQPIAFALPKDTQPQDLRIDGRAAKAARRGGIWSTASDESRPRDLELTYVLRALPDARRLIGPDGTFLAGGWTPRLGQADFTYRLEIAAPAGQRAVAAGRLVDEQDREDGYRAVFESEFADDHVALFAGPYQVREREHEGIRLRTYFHPGLEDLADGYLEQTTKYLDLYADWIGAYPFSAFHIVSGPLPVGLGFRNMTYIGIRVLRLPFIRFTSLGHEVLHNWWGNGVGVDYARGNWSEGLTTFMADYTYAEQRDPKRARGKRLDWLRDYAALPADRDRPVRAFVSKSHDAAQVVGYNKVAFIFHMLRQRLGTEAFDAGIRAFWQANRFRRAGWNELRTAFEAASGQDLARFFAQWLERTGAPDLRLSGAAAGPGNQVRFTLAQVGRPYALKIPVRLQTSAGAESHLVDLTTSRQSFTLNAGAGVTGLRIDPDFDLFRRLVPGETPPILRDVTLDRASGTVVLADGASATTARRLAARLLDTEVREVEPDPASVGKGPLLLIGLAERVHAFRRAAGLPDPPREIAGEGSARVWVERVDGNPVLTVAAADQESLAALMRPLPHYGRRSYLVFDGRKAVVKGAWPATASALAVRFD